MEKKDPQIIKLQDIWEVLVSFTRIKNICPSYIKPLSP